MIAVEMRQKHERRQVCGLQCRLKPASCAHTVSEVHVISGVQKRRIGQQRPRGCPDDHRGISTNVRVVFQSSDPATPVASYFRIPPVFRALERCVEPMRNQ